MTSKFTELAVDCADPGGLARFWCSVLDYEVQDEDDGIVTIGSPMVPAGKNHLGPVPPTLAKAMGAGSYLPTQRGTSSASLRTAAPDRRPHTAPDLLPVAYPRSREHDEEPLQRWRIPTRARSNSANFLTHDTAFEIESTTSIYSGLLRMSDLIAMQPNLNIPLFLVAPEYARQKCFAVVNRPTFARLSPPLVDLCRYISFSTLRDYLAQVTPFVRYL